METSRSSPTGGCLRPQTRQAPQQPAGHADSPMTDRVPQSRLWKSPQALVLQYLLQVRIP